MKIKILVSFLCFFYNLRRTGKAFHRKSCVTQWVHFKIDEKQANHVELVAVQCASLYTFLCNNHIWLNVAKWERAFSCCNLAKQIFIRIFFSSLNTCVENGLGSSTNLSTLLIHQKLHSVPLYLFYKRNILSFLCLLM